MNANELQIGDWVNWHTYKDRPHYCRITRLEQFRHLDCDPIPLTAEILEKNGWTKRKGYPAEYEFIDGECMHIYYDTKHCHLMIDLYDDNLINIVETRTHRLQQALRLCGLTEIADNFQV